MRVKSTRFLLISFVCGLFFGLAWTAHAAAATPVFKERFPSPVVAHLHIPSPWQLLSDMDDATTRATKNVPQAKYPAGAIKVFSAILSPLPFGAWKTEEEVHALFAIIDEEPKMAIIVSAGSLDDFAAAMDGRFEEDDFGNKVFLGRVKGSLKLAITALGGEKFFVTDDEEAYGALRPCLDEWYPSSPARSGGLLRIDFQAMLQEDDDLVKSILEELKEEYFDTSRVRESLADQIEEESDPDKLATLVKFESFLTGWQNTGDLFETTTYALFTMIDMLGLGFDFSGDQLELSFAISGVDNSILEEKISEAQALSPLPFLFADKVPEDNNAYMAGTNTVNIDREALAFSQQILYELFEKAIPDIPGLFAMQSGDYLHAGLRECVSFVHALPDGGDVESFYSTWDNPDEVIPLIGKGCTTIVKLQEALLTVLNAEDVEHGMDDEDEDDLAWFENIKSDGFLAPIRPISRMEEYAPTGDRYMHVRIRCDFEQFIPPSRRDDGSSDMAYLLADQLETFQLVVMQKDGVVIISSGLLPDVEPSALFDSLFAVWNGDTPNFAEITETIEHAKPKQNDLAVLRPLDLIVDQMKSHLPTFMEDEMSEEEMERLLDSLDSLDNGNAPMFIYGGADESAFVQTLILPAKTVNIGMKNVFRVIRDMENRGR